MSQRRAWWVAHAAGALCLLWVAVANGFPLLYSDSGTYLRIWTELYFPRDRPVTYGLLIAPFAQLGGLWAVVIGQALFTIWVVGRVVRALCPDDAPATLLVVGAMLAALTSLPWFAAQIMPDLFTGLAALVVFLVVCCDAQLSRAERLLLPLLLACLIAVHLSHLLIVPVLIALAAAAAALFGHRVDAARAAARAASAVVLAVLGLSSMNWIVTREFRPSISSDMFLLARLFDGHVAQGVLDQTCRTDALTLCAVRPMVNDPALRAPGQSYLWGAASPRDSLTAPDRARFAREEAELVHRTIATRTGAVARLALDGWGRQLIRTRAAEDLTPSSDASEVARQIERHFPGEVDAWRRSREQAGTLGAVAVVPDRALAVVAALLVPMVLIGAVRRHDRQLIGLTVVALGTLIVNAAVCGALSGPLDRYQSRVLWLLPFLVLVAAARMGGRRVVRRLFAGMPGTVAADPSPGGLRRGRSDSDGSR